MVLEIINDFFQTLDVCFALWGISSITGGISRGLRDIGRGISGGLSDIARGISQGAKGIAKGLGDVWDKTAGKGLKELYKGGKKAARDVYKEGKRFIDRVRGAADDAADYVKDAYDDAREYIADKLDELGITGAWRDAYGNIVDFALDYAIYYFVPVLLLDKFFNGDHITEQIRGYGKWVAHNPTQLAGLAMAIATFNWVAIAAWVLQSIYSYWEHLNTQKYLEQMQEYYERLKELYRGRVYFDIDLGSLFKYQYFRSFPCQDYYCRGFAGNQPSATGIINPMQLIGWEQEGKFATLDNYPDADNLLEYDRSEYANQDFESTVLPENYGVI